MDAKTREAILVLLRLVREAGSKRLLTEEEYDAILDLTAEVVKES